MSTRRVERTRLISIENQPTPTTPNFEKQTQEKMTVSDTNDPYDFFEYDQSYITDSSYDIHCKSTNENSIRYLASCNSYSEASQLDRTNLSTNTNNIFTLNEHKKRSRTSESEADTFSSSKRSRENLPALALETTDSSKSYHPASILSSRNMMSLNWHLIHSPGVGLMNNGNRDKNLCFINAVLQCLAYTPALTQWLLSEQGKLSICQISLTSSFCSVCHLTRVITSIHRTSHGPSTAVQQLSVPSAYMFSRNVTELSKTFTPGQQEDSDEFLNCLLNHLVKCLTSTELPLEMSRSFTTIDNLFRFEISSLITCSSCKRKTRTTEPYFILNISIKGYTSLCGAIKGFFQTENMCNENAYKCENCCKYVEASKTSSITNVSPYLILSLKRFERFGLTQNDTRKLSHFIAYPETIDINPYLSDNIQQISNENNESCHMKLHLYAVIVHIGHHVNEGHLFAYVRGPDDCWYKANDSTVTRVTLNEVLSSRDAYLLFYADATLSLSSIPRTVDYQSEATFSLGNQHSLTNVLEMPIVSDKFNRILDSSALQTKAQTSDNYKTMSSITIEYKKPNVSDSIENEQYHSSSTIYPPLASTITIENNVLSYDIRSLNETNLIMNTIESDPTTSTNKRKQRTFDDEDSPIVNSPPCLSCSDSDEDLQPKNAVMLEEPPEEPSEEPLEEPPEDFHKQLQTSCSFRLRSIHIIELQEFRDHHIKKQRDKSYKEMGLLIENADASGNKLNFPHQKSIRSTNNINADDNATPYMKYFYVILPYVKQFNPFCGLCVQKTYYGRQKGPNDLILRCQVRCKSRPICPFTASIYTYNDGRGMIVASKSTVHHPYGKKVCRPIRAPLRNILKEKLLNGASVFRVRRDQDEKRSKLERLGNNFDLTGASMSTIRKIKQEAILQSSMPFNVEHSLSNLYTELQEKINKTGVVKGALQMISQHPRKIIVFTETSIRLYDNLMTYPDTIISWDATGGIVKQSGTQRVLYYELTITLPGVTKESSLVPVTFMISDSHSQLDVKHWLEHVKTAYKKIFVGKEFPRPRLVLSDRALVFLLAALDVWNGENMQDFLNRSYRIVTNNASQADLTCTNVHACLAHIMLDTRKKITKCLDAKLHEISMWSIALLINTNDWKQFQMHWLLICRTFFSWHKDTLSSSNCHYDALLDRISKIKGDPNLSTSIEITRDDATITDDFSTFDDQQEVSYDERLKSSFKSVKGRLQPVVPRIIDEESFLNSMNSPFKSILTQIYNQCLDDFNLPRTKITKDDHYGIYDWFNYLLTYFLPTAPIWSNMLLGDLTRHRKIIRTIEARSFQEQRTTANSERRMGILKRSQLGGQVHTRLDIVVSLLVTDMISMVDDFTTSLAAQRLAAASSSNSSQQIKLVEEHWQQKSKRGRGHYTKAPDDNIISTMKSNLLTPSLTNINEGLSLPILTPEWLNVAIGVLLSVESVRNRAYPSSTQTEISLLQQQVVTFIQEYVAQMNRSNTSTNRKKSNGSINNLNIHISIPTDVPNDKHHQLFYILETLVSPIINNDLEAIKTFVCIKCNKSIRTYLSTSCPILLSALHGLFSLEREIFNYFAENTSDRTCTSCSTPMLRRISVIHWPDTLLFRINRSEKSSSRSQKAPDAINLEQFNESSNIGIPGMNVFDLTCFVSIHKYANDSKLVRVTKVKNKWMSSVNSKLIGEGDIFRNFYGNSHLLILERVRRHSNTNFINAIIQCIISIANFPSTIYQSGMCDSLYNAIHMIENNDVLEELCEYLIADITTRYLCNNCQQTSASLSSRKKAIPLFMKRFNNNPRAACRITSDKKQVTSTHKCSFCDDTFIDQRILNIDSQVFHTFPKCIMSLLDDDTGTSDLFDHRIQLIDEHKKTYHYHTESLIFVSKYSNSITVLRKESMFQYLAFRENPYSDGAIVDQSDIMDLYDTSSHVIIISSQVNLPSSPNIISIDNECSIDDSADSFDTVSSESTESQRIYADESPEDRSIFDVFN